MPAASRGGLLWRINTPARAPLCIHQLVQAARLRLEAAEGEQAALAQHALDLECQLAAAQGRLQDALVRPGMLDTRAQWANGMLFAGC